MSIFNMIHDVNPKMDDSEMVKICFCTRHNGKLYFNKKTGKLKTSGGCSKRCIKAIILALKYNIRFELVNKAIEEKSITL